ncbi:MAG: kup [Gemmatimonadetes bacterium]|nr:kup [Gemmatimonadota bacterium]
MTHDTRANRSTSELAFLALAALGVVYGDIGTSPLYALKECFNPLHGLAPTRENVMGVMSLVFWAMNFVVSFKYITFVLKADNRGEGGILALLALVRPQGKPGTRRRAVLVGAGLFGAALLYGDGIITPAISVLGAVEGLTVATNIFEGWVPYLAAAILLVLFLVQRTGTSRVGAVFGPVMVIWFICIALLGLRGLAADPSVLAAINPIHAIRFFRDDGMTGFLILGSVVLVVTGGEALYADMGHFGRRPIRLAWFAVALPALLLNYFGQSAWLLHHPEALHNPFYALVPPRALYPMVAIATAAAVVASQALISGAFSLTQQAVQLGYSPRVTIQHTSARESGQIYIPQVNAALCIGCIALVLGMRSSTALAAAYGIAVTGTMIITTLLFHTVTRERWHWPVAASAALASLFLVVDLGFFGANLVKVESGGWIPLVVAAVIYLLMTTWSAGRRRLWAIVRENTLPFDLFLPDIARRKPPRVPGTAVFLTSEASGAPPVLLHHLKHNKMLHERVVIMSVATTDIPLVPVEERIESEALGEGFYLVKAHYGFMETPDVPLALLQLSQELRNEGKDTATFRTADTSFYLGRETLIVQPKPKAKPGALPRGAAVSGEGIGGLPGMPRWRKKLFALMARNAQSATAFFQLPPNRVVELGAQIQF